MILGSIKVRASHRHGRKRFKRVGGGGNPGTEGRLSLSLTQRVCGQGDMTISGFGSVHYSYIPPVKRKV